MFADKTKLAANQPSDNICSAKVCPQENIGEA